MRVAAAIGAAVLALGCADRERPDLLWIVSDTFRADALDCADAPNRTPHLCALEAAGVRFDDAVANGAWTLPSAVGLLTGRHPASYALAREDRGARSDLYFVPDEEQLFAEVLASAGYATAHFVENPVALRPNAFQGFGEGAEGVGRERELEISSRLGIAESEPRWTRIAPVLDFLLDPPAEPFFVVQWIGDPHTPYAPPEGLRPELGEGEFEHPAGYYSELRVGALSRVAPAMSRAEQRLLNELYLAEVRFVDERIGAILRALELGGRSETTFVLFTSDHGEGFGEHGSWTHGRVRLYGEFVRVPLVVEGPGVVRGRRVAVPVSHVDLVPTFCELLRVECASGGPGSSLAELLIGSSGRVPGNGRLRYVGMGPYDALLRGDHKLIVRRRRSELYDLAADPGETRDLSSDRPELLAELQRFRRKIRDGVEADRARLPGRDDLQRLERLRRDTEEKLEELGYLE